METRCGEEAAGCLRCSDSSGAFLCTATRVQGARGGTGREGGEALASAAAAVAAAAFPSLFYEGEGKNAYAGVSLCVLLTCTSFSTKRTMALCEVVRGIGA